MHMDITKLKRMDIRINGAAGATGATGTTGATGATGATEQREQREQREQGSNDYNSGGIFWNGDPRSNDSTEKCPAPPQLFIPSFSKYLLSSS